MEEKRTDLLALLLRPELPNVQKELPTAEYRVKRLSEALGTDVVFKLRALPYGKVKSIRDSVAGDPGLDILLAGCVEPDLKAKELKEKYDRYRQLVKKESLTDDDYEEVAELEYYLDEIPDYLALGFMVDYKQLKLELAQKE